MTYAFDTETLSNRISDNHWQLRLASDWSIGDNPNGGYLLACLLRSMMSLVPDTPDPIAVTTHYLRPGLPGAIADLRASIIRSGRRTATVAGTMEQDGKPRLTCTVTFGSLDHGGSGDDDATERTLTMPAPDLPPPEECTTRSTLAQAVELPIMNRLEVRIDPQYQQSGHHDKAIITGWIRFKDERPVDSLALPLFCDAFPPSVFTLYGAIGWVPTIELSVHVRRRPYPGWIKGAFTVCDLAGKLFIEDGVLWDENNQLIARSRQLQMILT
ncbi:MAG: thioesterase family protein [Granulosicoccus sp.]